MEETDLALVQQLEREFVFLRLWLPSVSPFSMPNGRNEATTVSGYYYNVGKYEISFGKTLTCSSIDCPLLEQFLFSPVGQHYHFEHRMRDSLLIIQCWGRGFCPDQRNSRVSPASGQTWMRNWSSTMLLHKEVELLAPSALQRQTPRKWWARPNVGTATLCTCYASESWRGRRHRAYVDVRW